MNGAEAIVRGLEAHGVSHVFGVCGDTSVGLYRAFAETDHDVTHILARDERGASFMADAYARLSKKPGVCEAPSGGGATYLLPGLTEANDSAVPVVAMNTTIPTRYRGRGVLTELDQDALFDPVTKWNVSIDHPDLVTRMLGQAFRKATGAPPGVSHLSLPMDVLNSQVPDPPSASVTPVHYPRFRADPSQDHITEAIDLLETSSRPVIVVGGGVHSSRAWKELRTFAEHLGIPVAQTLTSCGCIGDSPYSIGVVGENGYREYANTIVSEADAVVLLGTAVESVWTSKWSRPNDSTQSIIHVDIDPDRIGLNYQTDVAIPSDLRKTLRSLLEHTEPANFWEESDLQRRHETWMETYEPYFDSSAFPLRPERMVADTNRVLDDDAIIVSDPGTSCPYFAALYDFPTLGRNWLTPRAHGALGYTIPGVIGAHYARPTAQIVGFTGDGSFGTSVGDLETIAREDIPVTIVVVNNTAFSWIEAGQRSYADYSFGVDFSEMNYADIARGFGITAYRVEEANRYESVLQDAVHTESPVLIDLPVEPLPNLEHTPVDWLEPDD